MENPAAYPRFSFGFGRFVRGIELIPAMIGLFAISEMLRMMAKPMSLPPVQCRRGSHVRRAVDTDQTLSQQWLRGSAIGTSSVLFRARDATSRHGWPMPRATLLEGEGEIRQRTRRGHREGGAANNAAVSGNWIPALVFGIPGDSITAIVIGVLYLKNLNPGPLIFRTNPSS